jgi:hypothetical protein
LTFQAYTNFTHLIFESFSSKGIIIVSHISSTAATVEDTTTVIKSSTTRSLSVKGYFLLKISSLKITQSPLSLLFSISFRSFLFSKKLEIKPDFLLKYRLPFNFFFESSIKDFDANYYYGQIVRGNTFHYCDGIMEERIEDGDAIQITGERPSS